MTPGTEICFHKEQGHPAGGHWAKQVSVYAARKAAAELQEVRAASGRLTDLHLHLFGHHLAVKEERQGALLITGLVEEVQDVVLDLAVVAVE